MSAIPHGTFTIHRTYQAPPARVFAAWADAETKARWFVGPPDVWTLLGRELDFHVGGRETLEGRFPDGLHTRYEARFHAIEPGRRLVFVYDMFLDGAHHSLALATLELEPTEAGGTRMTFTESTAYFTGEDGTCDRERGTAAHFDRLAAVLDDMRAISSVRRFAAPREAVWAAFADPARLATWWGPAGFANAFHAFELRPGGDWRFTMTGPDGATFEQTKRFVEVAAPARVAFDHVQAGHGFRMTIALTEVAGETLAAWRMAFDEPQAPETMAFIAHANEQNFDRLAAHLAAPVAAG